MLKAQIYRGGGTARNRWRWRLVARNGKKLAVSGEAFFSKSNAERAFQKMSHDLIHGRLTVVIVEPKKKRVLPGGRPGPC